MKFASQILTTYWHQILAVLSVPLSARNISNAGSIASLLGSESSKGQGGRERDAICLSLDALRKAAGLSCTLGEYFQDRSSNSPWCKIKDIEKEIIS